MLSEIDSLRYMPPPEICTEVCCVPVKAVLVRQAIVAIVSEKIIDDARTGRSMTFEPRFGRLGLAVLAWLARRV